MDNTYLYEVVATKVKCSMQDKENQPSVHTKTGRKNMKL